MLFEHWPTVQSIYESGMATGQATFQTEAPSWQEWDSSHLQHSRLIALDENKIIGWAALTPVSGRCVYAGVAEVSVYVAQDHRGRKVGEKLLRELINSSERQGIWTLQAGIFPENSASIKIHENCGFRILGRRERIGQMNNIWRDTILMEKRSSKVGIK